MSNLIVCTILLAITLSLLNLTYGKICYKESVINYTAYAMNINQTLKKDPRNHTAQIPVCCEGYENIGKPGVLPLKCRPICNPLCGNGQCNAPNHCSCDTGYKQSEHGDCVADENVPVALISTQKTVPISPSCDPPCGEGGICYLPNRCACSLGYVLSDESETCVRDENVIIPQTSTSTSTTTTTVPFITSESKCGPCHLGTCMLDVFCVCPIGYNLTAEGNCEPMCFKSCGSGRCIAPNMCECTDGYTFDSESLQCKPMCNGKIYGCIRGTCVGYNQCHCDSDTVIRKNELFECVAPDAVDEGSLKWLWIFLGISILAAGIAVSFYIIIRRSRYVLANRMDSEHETNYIFSSNNPATNVNNEVAKHTNGYTMAGFSFNEDTIGRKGNVVIINT